MKRKLSIAVAVLLLLPLLMLGWLMKTESGLHWAYGMASPRIPGDFSTAEISGTLSGPVTLSGVEFRLQDFGAGAERIEFDWDPWALLTLKFEITRMRVESLTIDLPAIADSAPVSESSFELPGFVMPIAVQLDDARIEGIGIRRGESAYRIARIGLQLDAQYNRFEIASLEIETDELAARLDGKITARQGYPHELGFDWRGNLPSGAELSGKGSLAGDLSSTKLQQQVQGALQLEQTLDLEDLLSSPRWRSTIAAPGLDLRQLDPALPEVSGSLEATAEGDLVSASASGSFEGSAPQLGAFEANFRLHSLDGERRYDGIGVEVLNLEALAGSIATSGRVEWLPTVGWTAEVAARGIDPAELFAEWPGRIDSRFDTSGSYDAKGLAVRVDIAELQGSLRDFPVKASGAMRWTGGNLDIDGLEVASGGTRISASGNAGESLDLNWKLDSGNLGELYPGAAGSLEAEGVIGGRRESPRIEAGFEGKSLTWEEYRLGTAHGRLSIDPLQLERFDVQLVAGDVTIHGEDLRSLEIIADPSRIEARLAAAGGSAHIALEGGFHDYDWRGKLVEAEIESEAYSSWKLLAPAALELATDTVSTERICLQSLQQARACAAVSRQPESWNFDVVIDSLPLPLLAPWTPPQLRLDGVGGANARLSYRPASRELLGNIDIALPPGRAELTPAPDKPLLLDYEEVDLDLQLQPSAIEARGRLKLVNGDSLDVGTRLPGARLLELDLDNQPLEGTLRGRIRDLDFVEILSDEIEHFEGSLEFDLAVAGNTAKPQLRGELHLAEASLRAARPELRLALEDLDLVARGDESANVTYRATATLGAGRVELDGDTRLDADAGWPSRLRIAAKDFAAWEYLAPLLPPEVSLEGLFEADADLRFSAPSGLFGNIALESVNGVVHYPLLEDEIERWEYRGARVELRLAESGIDGNAGVSLGDNNRLQGRLELPKAKLLTLDPDAQVLAASARVDFQQLEVLQALVPDISRPEGRLTLEIDAAGTLARPNFRGRAELADATVDIPRLGLKIKQIAMSGTSDDDGRFNFELAARSGDGSLNITGSSQLDAASGWPTRIEINGENFEAARIPEASVNLSPALVVVIVDRRIDISGDLRVPFARLQPRDVTTAEKVSSDAVVIGGDEREDPGWLVTTRVNLILGERVAFYGYGFDGQLTGRLLIEQQPGQPTSGTGEISIPEGRYRAYGQRLDIENGRVLFTGGPVTNPGLDIRATRDSNGIITGLLVRGRLRQPQIELFSIPAMGQTDILSYLLFGRPLETASGEDSALMAQAALTLGLAGGDQIARSLRERFGLDDFRVETADSGDQASLVVGRYLSPDVYVSYAVGLIESANSLNLRYRITDRWQLEAESGINHGADLLYTIER